MLAKASCKRTPLQPGRRPGQLSMHDPWSIIQWTVHKDNLICACKADRNRRPARPTGLGEGEKQKRRALPCSARPCPCVSAKVAAPPEPGHRRCSLPGPCFFSFRPFRLAKRALLASARSSCIHDNGSSREQRRSRSVAATGRQQRPVHSTILAAGTPAAVLASLDDVARSELSRQGSRTALLALPATRVWCDTRNAS